MKWMEAFESKGFKVNFGKTKVMVSGGITKDGISKSKVDPCAVCSLRVNAYSVLCLQCSGSTVDVLELKRLLQSFQEILQSGNVNGILEKRWSRKKSYVMKWKL